MLTFQHNQISKLENLISLPNLVYIDFFDNQIRQIQNLSNGIPTLKVLLLSKNSISKIKNVNELPRLEVLDLHSNKISKIENVGSLSLLKILNLSHNQIQRIENLQNLVNLSELNLKSNLISTIQNLRHLSKLEKLSLSDNRIEIKNYEACEISKMTYLKELSLENNPCSENKAVYLKNAIKYFPFLRFLDGKTPTLVDDQDSQEQ